MAEDDAWFGFVSGEFVSGNSFFVIGTGKLGASVPITDGIVAGPRPQVKYTIVVCASLKSGYLEPRFGDIQDPEVRFAFGRIATRLDGPGSWTERCEANSDGGCEQISRSLPAGNKPQDLENSGHQTGDRSPEPGQEEQSQSNGGYLYRTKAEVNRLERFESTSDHVGPNCHSQSHKPGARPAVRES